MNRDQLAPEAASKARNARRAGLALALLVLASALVWWSRGEATRSAVAAQPPARGEAEHAPAVAQPAQLTEARAVEAADAGRRALDAAAHEPSAVGDLEPPTSAANELANVNVLVLGLEAGERAMVEALVFDEQRQTKALGVHETDEHGRLALRLPLGRLRVSAWTHARVAPTARVRLATAGAELELRLAAAETISGRVTDARSGAPIRGARIALPKSRELAAALTDEHGRYELVAETDAQHALLCTAEGYAFERSTVSAMHENRWVHEAGQVTGRGVDPRARFELDFALSPARTIRGRVRDRAGALAGASVEALGHVETGFGTASADKAQARSDTSGAFELGGLRPDVGHVLTFRYTGYADALLHVPPSVDPLQDVGNVQLGEECVLDLLVFDETGARIEGLNVNLEAELARAFGQEAPDAAAFPRDRGLGGNAIVIDDRTSDTQNWHPNVAAFELGRKRAVRTSLEGAASFARLANGRYALAIDGHAPEALREPFELNAGEQRRVEVVLPAVAPITGRVLGAYGPVEGAMVSLGSRYTLSDTQGRFSFLGLRKDGSYTVQARWTPTGGPASSTKPVNAKPGAEIELRERQAP